MPAKPAYLHRLGGAIATLEKPGPDWIDRRMMEELLGISNTVAWRLLRRCGAGDGPGGALMIPRPALAAALRRLAEDGEFSREIVRRNRISDYLAGMARYARREGRKIVAENRAPVLLGTRFRSLPPGVELARTRLTIDFTGSADFLEKIGSVIYALRNDLEEISCFLDNEER